MVQTNDDEFYFFEKNRFTKLLKEREKERES